MPLPRFDSCCFGLTTLKVGSLIAAVFCLLVAISPTVTAYNIGGVWAALYTIIAIVSIIVSILLIIGVVQDNAQFVKYFVVVWFINVVYTVVFCVVAILFYHYNPLSSIVPCLLYVCIIGYCVCVVNSYFTTLTGESAIGA